MRSKATATPVLPGRPRSEHAQRAVLNAVRELVEKGGYQAATIEAIAARSGVAKTTIYRWWPNRAALVVELLVQISVAAAPPPGGSDPIGALRTELRRVAEAAEALPGRLLMSLLGEAERDPDVQRALMREIFKPRREATAATIRRAQESGEIRGDVPPLVAVDLLYGPLFYRKFVRHERVTGAYADEVFRNVLAGLQPSSSGRSSRTRAKPRGE